MEIVLYNSCEHTMYILSNLETLVSIFGKLFEFFHFKIKNEPIIILIIITDHFNLICTHILSF
jgi:hypothetical protein